MVQPNLDNDFEYSDYMTHKEMSITDQICNACDEKNAERIKQRFCVCGDSKNCLEFLLCECQRKNCWNSQKIIAMQIYG